MNTIGNKDFRAEVVDMYTNPERFKEVRDNLGASMNLAKTTDDILY